MRKGTQEKANNKYRVVVGVKPGEESGNRMVATVWWLALNTWAKSLYLVQKAESSSF